MSRVWFTSDTHFGHANVVNLDRAPFPNIETRDRFILEAHNAVVGPNDDVYHLGDVAFTQEHLDWYLSNANGNLPGVGRSMDVGVACNDYRPVSLEDVHARLGQIALRVNHHPESPRE